MVKSGLLALLLSLVLLLVLLPTMTSPTRVSISGEGMISFESQVALAASPPSRAISNSTYIFELTSDTVEVGNGETEQFEPHIRLNRWGGECYLGIEPAGTETEIEVEVEGDKIKTKYKVKQGEYEFELESEFYTLPPSEQYELGAFEWNTILNESPPTNRLVFSFEVQGLVLYHQPPLTQKFEDGWSEEFGTNIIVSETQVRDADTLDLLVERPDNIVNSIAVYHATKRDHILGQTNYMAGKAFHLFRGQAIDSNGWKVWVDKFLDPDRHEIVYVIPYDFWLNAKYPIRHALGDTFGYTSVGATASTLLNYMKGVVANPGQAGTGTSISVGIKSSWDSSEKIKAALYDAGKDFVANGDTEERDSGGASGQFHVFNFGTGPSLTAQNYYILPWSDSTVDIGYDTAAGTYCWLASGYGDWPSSLSPGTNTGTQYSIYCTYTLGAEANITNAPTSYNFGAVAASDTYTTGIGYFNLTNNGDSAIDVEISASNMTGGQQWALSDTAIPGDMVYGLKAGNTTDYSTTVKLNSPYNTLVENLADNTTWSWGMEFYAPTNFDDGAQKSSNVTLTASLAD